MIYTVTVNPAMDTVLALDTKLRPGEVNRSKDETIYCGGKGLNVSFVLSELGHSSRALGFVAGSMGRMIENDVRSKGIQADFIHLPAGESRVNVKIRGVYGRITQINGAGPAATEEAAEELFRKLDAVEDGDVLVLSGSLLPNMGDDFYARILSRVSDRNVMTVVDAEGAALETALAYRPFLIKPNLKELSALFVTPLNGDEEIFRCAEALQRKGARNVLISMAEGGALFLEENGKRHRIGVAEGKERYSVGAGDAMVAGFIAGYLDRGTFGYALRLGTACGGATAFSDGLARSEEIGRVFETLAGEDIEK